MAAPDFPRVNSLKLKNFKGIAELDIEFDESLTLLAGVNGAGKTSVVQALLAAVTAAWRLLPTARNYPLFPLPVSARRVGAHETEIVLGLALPEGVVVPFPSEGKLRFGIKEPDRRLMLVSDPSSQQFARGAPPRLPLIVYYEQSRDARDNIGRRSITISSERNRDSSLNTSVSSPGEFKVWFFEKEADEGQESRERKDPEYEDPELAEIRKLLDRLDGFTAVRSRKPLNEERTLYLEKDGANIPFDSLSGGEQAFFVLAADLARRLMLDSPDKPVAEAPAIVCIDEIELHLHPAWQRRILTTLMKTFPACQFVVTTHSPQVIGGVEARHVRLLTAREDGVREASRPRASKGRDSNYILTGVLDTPAREGAVNRLFAEFDDLVDDGDLETAERTLRALDQAVEGQSAAVATRQAKLNRLRRAAE